MTRYTFAAIVGALLGLIALVCWVWLFAQRERYPATRWIEPEDGVQPGDCYCKGLTE